MSKKTSAIGSLPRVGTAAENMPTRCIPYIWLSGDRIYAITEHILVYPGLKFGPKTGLEAVMPW